MKNNKKARKDRIKALIYGVFIILTIALVISTNAGKNLKDRINAKKVPEIKETEESPKLTYVQKQKKLENGAYKYNYLVIVDNKEIEYSGECISNSCKGIKRADGALINYKIDDNKAYITDGEALKEYTELYTGLTSELFDFTLLFDKLNSLSTIKVQEGELSKYIYRDSDYKYEISTTENYISSIIINGENSSYNFTFNY